MLHSFKMLCSLKDVVNAVMASLFQFEWLFGYCILVRYMYVGYIYMCSVSVSTVFKFAFATVLFFPWCNLNWVQGFFQPVAYCVVCFPMVMNFLSSCGVLYFNCCKVYETKWILDDATWHCMGSLLVIRIHCVYMRSYHLDILLHVFYRRNMNSILPS